MLKETVSAAFLLTAILTVCASAPIDGKDSPKEIQSAFGPAFDEIVVESSLTVRRKNGPRQARTKPAEGDGVAATVTLGKREKRQFPGAFGGGGGGGGGGTGRRRQHNNINNNKFPLQQQQQFPAFPSGGAAAANAQAQGFNSNGPLGSFGASATGAQTQSFNFGPGGINGAAGLSGAQTYRLPNGQTIDVSFGGTYSVGPDGKPAVADSSAITITNPNGAKQQLKG